MLKTILLTTALAIMTVSVAGCGGSDVSVPSSIATPAAPQTLDPNQVHIRGEITQISAPVAGESFGGFEVEGQVDSDTLYAHAGVRVVEGTQFLRRQGSETAPAKFEDLALGARVEVKFSGNVAGTSTVIAVASEVTILE